MESVIGIFTPYNALCLKLRTTLFADSCNWVYTNASFKVPLVPQFILEHEIIGLSFERQCVADSKPHILNKISIYPIMELCCSSRQADRNTKAAYPSIGIEFKARSIKTQRRIFQ